MLHNILIFITMLDIQIVSDLHTEFWDKKTKFNFIKPSAKILALAGDISCCATDEDFEVFKKLINELLPLYEVILFVSGNHEYYYNSSSPPTKAHTMQAIDEKIAVFFKLTSPKLRYLHNSAVTLQEGKYTYTIIGSTLWSWIPEPMREFAEKGMSDYEHIYVQDGSKIRKLKAADVSAMHVRNYKYLQLKIRNALKLGNKVIVLSHHKPYLSPDYNPQSLDVAYQSDLSSLFKPGVVLWGYGHTHIADKSKQGATILYSNPKGYPHQKTKYSKDAIVSV